MKLMNHSASSAAALITVVLAGCSTAPLAPPTARSAEVAVKLIAFNDFHGNLKTPTLRVPVADATQSVGFRFEPAGGVEQFGGINALRK